MNADAKLQHIKNLARARAKRYYENNKKKVLEKSQQLRDECKLLISKSKQQEQKEQKEQKEQTTNPINKNFIITEFKKTDVIKAIKDNVIPVYSIMADGNKKNQSNGINNANLIFRIIGEDTDLSSINSNPKEFLNKMEQLKKLDGSDYSLSQYQKILDGLLNIIKYLKVPISTENDKILYNARNYYKMKYAYRNPQPATKTPEVRRYNEVLKMIEQTNDNEMIIVAKIFNEIPLRTELENIKYISTEKEINNKDNYIILPVRKNAKIIINDFKTKEKHNPINLEFSTNLSKLLRAYIKTKKLNNGDILFTKDVKIVINLISKIITTDKITNSNIIRRSIASALYDDYIHGKATFNDIAKQADLMKHNITTHMEDYVYKIKT